MKMKDAKATGTLPTQKTWHTAPHSNTGKAVTQNEPRKGECMDYPLQETVMVLTDDGPKPVLIRRPAATEVAVIDWLNVTIAKSTFTKEFDLEIKKVVDNDYCVECLSMALKEILGFGIEAKLCKGLMYYQETYTLENDCGHICIGGQQDTILLSLNGNGCTLGKYGWERDLYNFLRKTDRPKITRIDYAYDDLDGELISVDWAYEQDTLGGFTCHSMPPSVECRGDWKRPRGAGRTIYIGKRTSSKFCRVYEKGKQLGDKDSAWVRVEVEFKSKHYYIPIDALLHCSEHFLSAYPCFSIFDNADKAMKFETIRQKTDITWNKALQIVKHQFGHYIYAFREYYGDDSQVLDVLKPKKPKIPKRLKPLYVDVTQALPSSERFE